MVIVDCFWEERNLGLKTVEVEVSEQDRVDDVRNTLVLLEKEYKYLVIKAPTCRLDLYRFFSSVGYVFAESQFTVFKRIKDFDKGKYRSIISAVSLEKIVSEDSLDYLTKEIKQGVFTTDRIALDPNFGVLKANIRYAYWLSDIFIDKDSEIYFINRINQRIGFFAIKKDRLNRSAFGLLGGIFLNFREYLLGINIVLQPLLLLEEENYKSLVTKFSNNNISVLLIYQYLNFTVTNINNIFIKITEANIL